jgi:hypothetical protein
MGGSLPMLLAESKTLLTQDLPVDTLHTGH